MPRVTFHAAEGDEADLDAESLLGGEEAPHGAHHHFGEADDSKHEHAAADDGPAPRFNDVKLVATLVKSFIGSGVLFLPKAFQNGGWLFSVIVMVAMAVITQITIMRLIECRKVVAGGYGVVGLKAVGPWGQIAVDVSLVLSQAGFGCVYIIFIARNVMQLLNSSHCWLDGSWLWLLILLQWFMFTPLTWVRRISAFAPTNIAADALIALGLVGVMSYAIHGIATSPGPVQLTMFNAQEFSLFLGTAIYAYEGIGMVVPVFDSLRPADQARFPRLLSLTLAGITAVYCVVGVVPYVFLDGMAHVPMQDAVTLNLPRVWWSYAIVAGYCLALTFSYPLMLFPAINILEGGLSHCGLLPPPGTKEASYWPRNIARGAIVAITLLIALVGSEQLNNFVALIGAFCCCPLAFIYPSLFHFRLIKGASSASKALDVAIVAFGLGVFGFSTYQAIAQWSVSPINPCITN